MPFEITKEYLQNIQQLIAEQKNDALLNLLRDVHYADIAEIIEELNSYQATYLIKLLDSEKTSDVLAELDEDTREKILSKLSTKKLQKKLTS